MSAIQCELCVETYSLRFTPSDTANSLAKAAESCELANSVFVFCQDCQKHLCIQCDYKVHVGLPDGDSLPEEHSQTKERDSNSAATHSAEKSSDRESELAAQNDTQAKKAKTQPRLDEASKFVGQAGLAANERLQSHVRVQFCEECAGQRAEDCCPLCEQFLCPPCWKQIHNKGARLRHQQQPLSTPKFYPPHLWRKSGLTNQNSQGSSSAQDSLSQFKQEHVLNKAHRYEEKVHSSLLNKLQPQVALDNNYGLHQAPPNDPAQLPEARRMGSSRQHDGMHMAQRMAQPQQMMGFSQGSMQHSIYFGQSPQFVPHAGPSSMQASHLPINAAPFQPSRKMMEQTRYVAAHNMQMVQPGQLTGAGYMPHGGQQPTSYFMFPEHHQSMGSHYAAFATYEASPNHPHQVMVPMQAQSQSQGQPLLQQPQSSQGQTYGHPGDSHAYHSMVMQQNGWARQHPYSNEQARPQERSQMSEEDSISLGIHDEARHQIPSDYSDLDKGVLHHGAHRDRQHRQPGQNAARAVNGNFSDPRLTKFQNFDGRGTAFEEVQVIDLAREQPSSLTGKAFTPQRIVQHSSSEHVPSPMMDPRGDSKLIHGDKYSKLLTPPAPIGANSTRQNLNPRTGFNAGSAQFQSRGKPLKVPRPTATGGPSTNKSIQSAKPPIYSERKGPHIQWQPKAGKPSSVSSHDMNPYFEGEPSGGKRQIYKRVIHDQKSFDAYQLNQPHNKHNFSMRKSSNSQNSESELVHSQDGQDAQNAMVRNHLAATEDGANQGRGRRGANNAAQRNGPLGTANPGAQYRERCDPKSKASSGSEQPLNSSMGVQNESRGSASKTGSLSNYRSGSGGNPSRGLPASSQSLTQSRRSGPIEIPLWQPVIKLETESASSSEETKARHSSGSESDIFVQIQLILFGNAARGELLSLKGDFLEQLVARTGTTSVKALNALQRAVACGIIHKTDRNFANSQKIEFVSLKIQVLSHQCLQWVITSLRRDEMTPTESAIKNRTKEAFDFKLQADYWEAVMRSIQANRQPLQQTSSDQAQVSKQAITPPDKGSSAHTSNLPKGSNTGDSSFTQSSNSTQPVTTLTQTTVSAHGIVYLTKQSVATEADTGSGSTFKKSNTFIGAANSQEQQSTTPPAQNSSSGVSNSAGGGGETADQAPPKFKVVPVLQNEPEHSSCSGSNVGATVYAVYLEEEEVWTGVDIEDDSTVDRDLYLVMKDFLRDYFCAEEPKEDGPSGLDSNNSANNDRAGSVNEPQSETNQAEKRARGVNSDEYTLQGGDLRMIPGGRYGCTQFLKICGPESIKKCSVGKTTQMVQLAIKEDVLRHLKTQIVWSTQVDKHKSEVDTLEDQQILVQRKAKLEKVKEAIIEILAESKTGMSLAQLPQYLRKKLPFNLEWNELGFPKLKDLLHSMEDHIKVELRDVNHPFAYLVHKKLRSNNQSQHDGQALLNKSMFRGCNLSEQNKSVSARQMVYDSDKLCQIVQAVFTLLKLEPQGVLASGLIAKIKSQVKFEFTFDELGCSSIFEFLQKYILPKDEYIEFLMTKEGGDRNFLIRSNKIYCELLKKTVNIEQDPVLQKARDRKFNQHILSSSLSHKNFNRGPQVASQHDLTEDSEDTSGQQTREEHQRIVQTQPDAHDMPYLSGHQHLFPSCESIHGSDTNISDYSSLQNQVKAIQSDLPSDFDQVKGGQSRGLAFQQASTPPFTQQAQKIPSQRPPTGEPMGLNAWSNNNQVMQQANDQGLHGQAGPQPHFYPWCSHAQDGSQFVAHAGFGNGLFDNVKINSNIHSNPGMTQGPHRVQQQLYYMPIDAMHQPEEEQRQQEQRQRQANSKAQQHTQQQPNSYQIFHPCHYGDADSPRMQETMQRLFDESSPMGHGRYFQAAQQHAANADAASELETQQEPISERLLNESIFSESFNLRRQNLEEESDAGHKSVDFNANSHEVGQAQRSSPGHNSLFLTDGKQDDQVTVKSWHPVSTLSHKLEISTKRPYSHDKINQVFKTTLSGAQSLAQGDDNQQPRITEETSGSNRSSNHVSPELEEGSTPVAASQIKATEEQKQSEPQE